PPPRRHAGRRIRAEAYASDPDGDGLTVSYILTTRPPGSTVLIGDAETLSPSFIPALPGAARLAIIADDGRGRSGQAEASTWIVAAGGADGGAPDVPVPEPD